MQQNKKPVLKNKNKFWKKRKNIPVLQGKKIVNDKVPTSHESKTSHEKGTRSTTFTSMTRKTNVEL